MSIHFLGVRHHGPGCAHSVAAALAELRPDCVLIEGPPEADALIPYALHEEIKPPVALLVYMPEDPQQAVFYPFADFSPEWQALRYGVREKVPTRFIDLPQALRLKARAAPAAQAEPAGVPAALDSAPDASAEMPAGALQGERADEGAGDTSATGATTQAKARGQAQEPSEPSHENSEIDAQAGADTRIDVDAEDESDESFESSPEGDPLSALAEAAGYSDADTWWEHLVEERRDSLALFAAIAELMRATRQDDAGQWIPPKGVTEARREAHMRQMLRAAHKEGFARIAVICGAFHVPALAREDIKQKDDAALLKGLPKVKTAATWVPWSYGRLTYASGYGAGIHAPGWYEHLWRHPEKAGMRWLMDAAHLLRKNDLEASSAHVIEAVRLADTLAALRERPRAGLSELTESVRAVFCGDSEAPLQLIARDLLVADRLGHVPASMPMLPLPRDVEAQQKRLRLAARADRTGMDLDLREPAHLEKSIFLHRLALLGIPWGKTETVRGKSGTFHELWQHTWEPEFSIKLIEANIWGGTVEAATTRHALHRAGAAENLPQLTALVEQVLLADLKQSIGGVMAALDGMSARTSDLGLMLGALPPLANVLRYGNVRGTDVSALGQVVDGLVTRAAIALPPGTQNLNDEAAAELFPKLTAADHAVRLTQSEPLAQTWTSALTALANAGSSHPLLAGRACRILLDQGHWPAEEAARRLALVCSNPHAANGAALGAANWIEGFLQGSGSLLVHQDALFAIIDQWVAGLDAALFQELLPLLRRTFGAFDAAEKQRIYERATQPVGAGASHAVENTAADLDEARAALMLPTLYRLYGIAPPAAASSPGASHE